MSEKVKMRTKQLVLRELLEIIELWPNIPISQHMVCIMRPYSPSYKWSDELLLKKIEKYRYELETDKDDGTEEDDDA
jgi:hypothetical protein